MMNLNEVIKAMKAKLTDANKTKIAFVSDETELACVVEVSCVMYRKVKRVVIASYVAIEQDDTICMKNDNVLYALNNIAQDCFNNDDEINKCEVVLSVKFEIDEHEIYEFDCKSFDMSSDEDDDEAMSHELAFNTYDES